MSSPAQAPAVPENPSNSDETSLSRASASIPLQPVGMSFINNTLRNFLISEEKITRRYLTSGAVERVRLQRMPDGGFVTIHEEVPTRVVNVGNGGVPFSRMAPNTTARYLDETIGLILTTKEPASQQYDPDLEELIVRLVAL